MPRLFRFLLACVPALVAACSENGGGFCEQLETCCNHVPAEQQASCYQVRAAANQTPTPAMSCQAALMQFEQQYQCRGGGTGQTDNGSNGGSGNVCDDFLACVEMVVPDQAAGLKSSYGPDGACWNNGDAAKNACLNSCRENLSRYVESGQCEGPAVDAGPPDAGRPPQVIENVVTQYCKAWIPCISEPDAGQESLARDIEDCEHGSQSDIDDANSLLCKNGFRDQYQCELNRGCDTSVECNKVDESCYPPHPVAPPSVSRP